MKEKHKYRVVVDASNPTKRQSAVKLSTKSGQETMSLKKTQNRRPLKSPKDMGERLKKLRKENGWTQKQICEALDVTQPNWSSYERGQFYPSISVLLRLMMYSGLTMDYLVGLSYTKSRQDVSAYDMARILSNLLLFCGVNAEITDEGKLLLSVDHKNRHAEMMKSAVKKTIEYAETVRENRGHREMLEKVRRKQGEWLDKMRWEYDKWDLEEDIARFYL